MRLLPQVQQMLEEMQKSVQNLVSEGVCSASDIAAAIDRGRILMTGESCRKIDALSRSLGVLGDPTRARILFLLIGGEMCVCEIEAALNVRQANASHHLRVMEQAGLLKRTKKSRRAFYSAVSGELTELVGRAVEGA